MGGNLTGAGYMRIKRVRSFVIFVIILMRTGGGSIGFERHGASVEFLILVVIGIINREK